MKFAPLCLLFLACPPVPTVAPTIVSFEASPSTLNAAAEVTLSWIVADATSLKVDGIGPVFGTSTRVLVTSTTTFTLTAANALGSVQKSLTVTVNSAPSITSFTADKAHVPYTGDFVRLSWTQTRADALRIEPNVGDVTGLSYKDVWVTQSTTFTLTATCDGVATEASLAVVVDPLPPPLVISFTADKHFISTPTWVEIRWNVTDSAYLYIAGIGQRQYRNSGELVWVDETTTFTLTASNAAGVTTAEVEVVRVYD